MNIVRHGERLALCSGGCCRELARLHSIVKPEHSKIKERGQNAVDSVVEEIVQLRSAVMATRTIAIFTLSSSREI